MFFLDQKKFDTEGRLICAEYEKFFLVNTCKSIKLLRFKIMSGLITMAIFTNGRYSEFRWCFDPSPISTGMASRTKKIHGQLGKAQTSDLVRRPQRGTSSHRPTIPGKALQKRLLHYRGARLLHVHTSRWLFRLVSTLVSGSSSLLFLELSDIRPPIKRWLASRLLRIV